jgi:hypothetical protein
VSTPLPKKDNKEQKPKLTDKIQAAINQTAWDSTAAVSFSFRGITIMGQKRNLVQVEWDDKVLYNTQTVEGIAYENDKKLTDSEKDDAIKKGMTTSIMIHSGLSRLQITRCWYY